MSRTTIAVAFLIACLTAGIFSLVYVDKSCNKMVKTIENAESFVINKDAENAEKALTMVNNLWQKNRPLLNILTGQGEIWEVHKYLSHANYFYKCGDYQTALTNLQECKEYLQRIITYYKPSLTTIF